MEPEVRNKKQTTDFRDAISTVDDKGKRIWLYPIQPHGKLYKWRTIATILYLFVFFGLPFVSIDGEPFFLFNVIERKFVLFGQVFWPQDFFIFGLGMLLFIVFIILFTVVFGRVFCGWACPQTVFMEMVFRRIEYWIEGDGQYQKNLDHHKWSAEWIMRKSIKHVVFLFIAFLVSNTFLAYIIGKDELFRIATEPLSMHVGGFISILLFSLIFYAVFAFMREQVCTTVCPYGRLQGVMLDKDSIIVAYDHKVGEPREKFHKNEIRTSGNCIDCLKCVKVCPTGIDIRNGTQLECTNCTACIDVCDNMLDKVGLPKGLIRYTSENRIASRSKYAFTRRMKAYVAVLIVLVGVEVYLIATRKTVDATVNRARGVMYQELGNHLYSNLYSLKILNKKHKGVSIRLVPDGFKGKIEWVGKAVTMKESGTGEGMFFVIMDAKQLHRRKTKIYIDVFDGNKKVDRVKTSFFSPEFN